MRRTLCWILLASPALLLFLGSGLHAKPAQPGGSKVTGDILSCEIRKVLRTVDTVTGVGAALMFSPGTIPGSTFVCPGSTIFLPFNPDCDEVLATNSIMTPEPPLAGGYVGAPGRYPTPTGAVPSSGNISPTPSPGSGAASSGRGQSGVASDDSEGCGLLGSFIGTGQSGAGGITGSGNSLVGGGISGSSGSGITGASGFGNGGALGGSGGFGGGSGFGGGIAGSGGTSGGLGGSTGGGSGKGPPLRNPEPSSIVLLLLGSGGLLCYAGWKRRRSAL